MSKDAKAVKVTTTPVGEEFYQEKRNEKKRILEKAIQENRSLTESEEKRINQIDNVWLNNSNQKQEIRKDDKEMTNKEFKRLLNSGQNLNEVEVRADYDNAHHVMGTMTTGQDLSHQRIETLQQTIVRKMGEEAVLVGAIPFVEQRGKLKIPVSSNKGTVAKVSEGERFPEKAYNLSYVQADLVKAGCMAIITNEVIEDSELAIMQFVSDEVSRDFGRSLEADFLNGAITGKVEGVAVCPNAHVVEVSAVDVKSLKDAYFALPKAVRNANDLLFITDSNGVKVLDQLEDKNGRALLHPEANAQMGGKYFDKLYNANVVEVEATALSQDVFGVFVSPKLAVHAGMARDMQLQLDNSKRSEYDERVLLASMRYCMVVKDPDAIAVVKVQG